MFCFSRFYLEEKEAVFKKEKSLYNYIIFFLVTFASRMIFYPIIFVSTNACNPCSVAFSPKLLSTPYFKKMKKNINHVQSVSI